MTDSLTTICRGTRLLCLSAIGFCLLTRDGRGEDVSYLRDVKPILRDRCYSCHGAIRQESDLRLDTAALVQKGGDSGPAISPESPDESLLLARVTAKDLDERMPPEGDPLSAKQIARLRNWIQSGGTGPENEKPQPDPAKHWAFLPVARGVDEGPKQIDDFIDARLRSAGLHRNPPADPVTLVRRLSLDLHGLPPTPADVVRWTSALAKGAESNGTLDQAAVRQLIDELLTSPRYGERWAQHWLDIVRYADTHGYEVNTPRPNAWPYRDYVIRAFNEDKPYHEFIHDQLAGDLTGEDAATGFLVAAAALLPGQIGADDASRRLARQDSLDEIIVGTTATFLGLTLGCARCHDHKFDPFTQRDYYAFQAYFAGVEYGERPIQDATWQQRLAEAKKLQPTIDDLTAQLRRFEPLAFDGRTIIIDDEDEARTTHLMKKNGHGTNPGGTGRGYAQDDGSADRVGNISRTRYTWWPNRAGQDVFSWNPAAAGRFRLWISWGVHGSGVHTRDARYVLDKDGDLKTKDDQTEIAKIDQYYFSGVSTGESEKKPLWSGLFDAGVHELTESSRVILRGGESGTGITADVLVLQAVPTGQTAAAGPPREPGRLTVHPQLRVPVSFTHNVERFAPVEARFVRFTTFETTNSNRYEPCLDELEVFRSGANPENVARVEGVVATSSGNYSNTGKHQLKHINDGRYGNSFSWISSEKGGGWVQLALPRPETIDRIEWARDRTGQFSDRLPVRYRIAVSVDGESWTTVAQSDDRVPLGTPFDRIAAVQRAASGPATDEIPGLTAQLKKLQARKAELEKPRVVFGGVFKTPEVTRLLRRGDPEQPLDPVAPHIPVSLGSTGAGVEESDPERRRQLARWIASEDNPLTARVIVNRVWQFHFGRGLVDTPSDFGLRSPAPSHPRLLDWLAAEFMTQGWSIKQLHRMILTSATYQQSARIHPAARDIDGDARLLWRFPSRRLEAEAIRDSILAVSGQLNLKMGGPGFNFFKTRGGLSGFPPVEEFGPEEKRRMIYAHRIRMEPAPIFGAFDCPDAGQPTPVRSQSTTAIQALNLFNSPFVIDQAGTLAERARQEAGDDVTAQVSRCWLLTLGREPHREETVAAVEATRRHGLETVCRALFNSNEFLFLP